MTKKILVICVTIVLVMTFGMTFAGCKADSAAQETTVVQAEETTKATEAAAETETTAAATAEPVTLVWWDWQADLDITVVNPIVESYTVEHPNVTIERKQYAYNDYNSALKTELTAGGGPDILEIEPGAPTVSLVEAGTLKDLTDIILNDSEWSSWIEPALALRDMYVDGKIYTIPLDVNHLPIVYWKEMFESRGLEAPETIEDLIAVSETLSADGIIPLTTMISEKWPQVDIFVALARGADSSNEMIDKAVLGEVSWEDPLFKEVLQAMVDLKTKGVFAANIMEMGWADCLDLFNKKECAMVYPIGQFGLGSLDADAVANDEIGSIPFPKLKDDSRTLLTGGVSMAMGVNANSKNMEAAIDFIKYCNSVVGQEVIFDSMRTPPGAVVTKESDVAIFNLQTNNQSTMEIGYRRIDNPDLYQALQEGIDEALLGGNIDDILARIEQISKDVNG